MPLTHAGLGGIAANDQYVIFGDRDDDDFHDVFRCLDADTGDTVWEVQRLAVAALDYGNSPRATPLIAGQHVYCLGAHGNLLCIRIRDGDVVWERNFRDDFPLQVELPWGYCGSPLLTDGKLIVAPGAPDAALVALDASNGEIVWKSAGRPPSHGSLIVATLGGSRQIVGHDKTTLGGWDLATGERLWTVTPVADGDFNVPTPLISKTEAGESVLLIATENNGLRSFHFDHSQPGPPVLLAESLKLRTDMSSPIVVGDRLYCVKDFLFCMNRSDLKEQWRLRDRAIGDYAAVFATQDRLLLIGKGELLLLGTDSGKRILSRQRVFNENQIIYSHPAMVGQRLYIRGEHRLRCLTFPAS